MTALQANYLSILKSKLEQDFVQHLPELIDKTKSKEEQDKKQLSRAFSAFVFHKMLNISIVDAGKTVVDDFNDCGIDAIYYDGETKTLLLLQTKMKANNFEEPDAIRFRSGVELLLEQKYETFNENVKVRKDELNKAFDEAETIKLVVAYIGSEFSLHAKNALKQLTENESHHEVGRLQREIEEFDSEKVKVALLDEKSTGVVNDFIHLSEYQHLQTQTVPHDTHIGVALLSDLVKLHNKHEKALYERNIRYFLGTKGAVNKSIQETLRTNPENFFYLNNGVTALADIIEIPKGGKIKRKLNCRGLSIINGAQTISSAVDFVTKNPEYDISEAKVLVTLIKADQTSAFGQEITRSRNHQNPVSTNNFVALDAKQEELRRELAYLNFSYHYRPEAIPNNSESTDNIITIDEAIKALALFKRDSRYSYWIKNDFLRFQNTDSNEYKSLFSKELNATQLANMVRFYRFVKNVIASNANSSSGAESLFYRHGIFVIASVLAKPFDSQIQSGILITQESMNQKLSDPLDKCRQICFEKASPLIGNGRSVLAYFRNQNNTINLVEICMAKFYNLSETIEYQKVKSTLVSIDGKAETYPQERLFNLLISKAKQIK